MKSFKKLFALKAIILALFLISPNLHSKSFTIKIKNLGSITISDTGAKSTLNLPVLGRLEVEGSLDKQSGSRTIRAKLSNKTYKPFARTGVPGLKNISFSNPEIIFTKTGSEYEIKLSGQATIFRKKLIGSIYYKKGTTERGWVATLEIPGNIKPFSFVPGLGVFKKLNFRKSYIVASTIEYEDETLGATVKKGVGFLTKIATTGPLKGIQKVLGIRKSEISLYGLVARSGIEFRARLAGGSKSKSARVKFGKLELELVAKPTPSFAVITSIFVKPAKRDPYLEFIGKLALSPVDVRMSGTMKGTWRNPFGIKGIKISNVALEGAFNVQSGLPSALGFTGQIEMFGKKAGMAALLDLVQVNKSLVQFSLNKINLRDFITFAKKIGLRIPKQVVPNIGFKNIKFKVAPMGGKIGEISFEPGISFDGTAEILKAKIRMSGSIGKNGIRASGGTNAINFLNILKLRGSSRDPKARRGPYVELELSPRKQYLTVSGAISMLGIKSDTYVKIGLKDARFSATQKAGRWFEATIAGMYKIGKRPDFAIDIRVKNNIRKQILSKLKKVKPIRAVMSLLTKSFRIRSMQAKGSLKDISRGKTPSFKIAFTLFGKNMSLKLGVDLRKPANMIKKIVKKIVDVAKKYVFEKMKKAIKKVAKKIKNATKKAGKKIGRGMKKVFKGIGKGFKKIGGAFKKIGGLFKSKKKKRRERRKRIKKALKKVRKQFEQMIKISFTNMKEILNTSAKMMREFNDDDKVLNEISREYFSFVRSTQRQIAEMGRRYARHFRKIKELKKGARKYVKTYNKLFYQIAQYAFYRKVASRKRNPVRSNRIINMIYNRYIR